MSDTAKLIAQARATTPPGSFAWQLADALEAAEARRPRFCPGCGYSDWPENCPTACPSKLPSTQRAARLKVTDAEREAHRRDLLWERDENRRLREALDWIEAEPEDPIKVQLWARAALAGSGEMATPCQEPERSGLVDGSGDDDV